MHAAQEVVQLEGGNNYIESNTKFYKFKQAKASTDEYTIGHGGDSDSEGLDEVNDYDGWESDESATL